MYLQVRNSSLKRTSSVKSNRSAKSESSPNNSISDKQNDMSDGTTFVKTLWESDAAGEDEENEKEENGRPFTNEDFEDSSDSDNAIANTTLLLTETILEEDEDVESLERKSVASKKSPVMTPTSVSFPTDAQPKPDVEIIISPAQDLPNKLPTSTSLPVDVQAKNDVEISSLAEDSPSKSFEVTPTSENVPADVKHKIDNEGVNLREKESLKKNAEISTVKVEVSVEPRKLSVDLQPNRMHSKESDFLPPPLVSQFTREAIIPYYQEENISTEDSDISEITKEMLEANYVQEHPKEKITNKQTVPDLPPEEKTPSEKSKTSSDLGLPQNYIGKVEDDDDDRRTIGAASAVAVLGDDEEANMKDLVDDIADDSGNFNKGKFHPSLLDQDDIESSITVSSNSSISNLTDNTDELCNPNILEIIWSKCSLEKDYGYREIFGVKLRKISGRLRPFHSTMFDAEVQVSVGTQVPTPPPIDDSAQTPTKFSKFSSSVSEKKFIPSWPFDPNSLAVSTELDELDREAIKAALKAQKEVERDLSKMTSDPFLRHRLSSSTTKSSVPKTDLTKDLTEITYDESKSCKRDPIPGIPYFHKSVPKSSESSENSSRQSSRRLEEFSNSRLEALVYPPDIQPFRNNEVLKYEPENQKKQSNAELTTMAPPKKIDETYTHKGYLIDSAATILDSNEKMESQKLEDSFYHWKPSRLSDSGRSTPSSVSSFPRFVHSVYPLRKMSTNWGSESTMSQQDVALDKEEAWLEKRSESSNSVSKCSIKSVKGSAEESEEENIDFGSTKSKNSINYPSSKVTVFKFNIDVIDVSSNEKPPPAENAHQVIDKTLSNIPLLGKKQYEEKLMTDAQETNEEELSSENRLATPDDDEPSNDIIRQKSEEAFSPETYEILTESSTQSSSRKSSDAFEKQSEDLSINLSEVIPERELVSVLAIGKSVMKKLFQAGEL